MNRSYRIVFNRKTGIYQVASEKRKSRGKDASARAVLASGLAAAFLSGASVTPAWAADLILDNLPAYIQSGGSAVTYGQISVGNNGTGELGIQNGGVLVGARGVIGRNPGSAGTATVTGIGSSWATGSSLFFIGDQGTGTLNIEAGGVVNSGFSLVGASTGGTGTVIVSGAGSTWTNTGRLLVGSSGTGMLTVTNGGQLTSAYASIGVDVDTFNNNSLGTGTVTLTGIGSSWINSATVFIGNYGNGVLNIEDGATFRSDTGFIAVNAGSSGIVTVKGAGSTWINSGALDIATEGNGTLNIEDGGVVKTGAIMLGFRIGTAALNLSGTEGNRGILQTDYIEKSTGSTTTFNWNGGILQAKANEANFLRGFAAGNINLQAGGAYIDTQAFNVGIRGVLTGSGGLTKLGSGTLSIAGANAYTGNTTVSDGTLQFNTYTQNASQTLGIGASSNTNYSKLVVNNSATFASDSKIYVDVKNLNTLAWNQTLKNVISAGTLNASTFIVSDNSALFNFSAIKNGNAVDLVTSFSSTTGVYDAVIGSAHYQAQGAARVLDSALNNLATGDMGSVVSALGSLATQGEVGRAASQTLPAMNAGVTQVGKGVLNTVNKLIENRQGGASGVSGGDELSNRSAWLKPFGSRASQDDKDGISGFNATTWGLAGGIEGDLSQGTRIGVAYAYANSKVDGNTALSGAQQRVNIDAHVLALYGATELANGMTLGFQGDIGQNSNDGTRNINFGGLNRTATSDYKTYTAHAGISLAKSLALDERTSITPRIRADYTWLRDQGYRERGANALNLDVAKNSSEAFVLGADARISHVLSNRSQIEAYAGAGYDTINKAGNIVASYAGALGQAFATPGISHSPWLFAGGLGYVHQTMGGTEISLRYDVEGRSDYTNQSASVKAKWAF